MTGAAAYKKASDAPGQVEAVKSIIDENKVVLFSKSTCPYCLEMKRVLDSYGVSYELQEVNESENPVLFMSVLREISGIATVPNLFVEGQSIGGCIDSKSLEHSGKLLSILAPFMTTTDGVEKNRAKFLGFLWFPAVVDRHNARLTSLLTAIYCLLCVIFYDRLATRWVVLALALDFLLRFTFGGHMSVGGTVSALILSRIEPKFIAGPPKQFAAFCGLFMSTFAAGLYVSGYPVGGAVMMTGLMCAAGLEGVLDFCLGCWMFGYGIKFNLISKDIYRPYLNLVEDRKWMYQFSNTHHHFKPAKHEHVLLPWQSEESPADLVRKNRIETEYKNSDVDCIRHARVDLFAVPMTVAALAYVFKLTDGSDDAVRFNTSVAYQTLAIISVILFAAIGTLFLLRAVLYPRKVVKEWRHPVSGNMYSAITICITLYGLLLLPHTDNGGGTFIWIGAVGQMLMVVLRLVDQIQDYQSKELINPSLMMIPVGAFISAIGFAQFELAADGPNMHGKIDYVYLARLWYGVAALFSLVLFTITFKKALHDHHSDNRLRPTLWIWQATFSIAGPALLSVSFGDPVVGKDVLFQSLWCISLFFFAVNSVGLLRNFFSYVQDMSIWLMPFSLTAFALSTVQYYAVVQDQLFMVLSIITIVVACTSTAICACYTISWLISMDLFKPRPKWGPISFMKLTHECFRFAIPKYVAVLFALRPTDTVGVQHLLAELDALFITFFEHSHHEDMVLFPRVRRYFPGLNTQADEEHELEHGMVEQMQKAIAEYRESDQSEAAGDALLQSLRAGMPDWEQHVLPHLRNEEITFTVAARKYLPVDEQVKLTADVFELTEVSLWRKVMPFVVRNLPSGVWKVRYVKTFVWACPARAQEIGLMLYHGVDSVTWLMLARELPQIVPRGVDGFKRMH